MKGICNKLPEAKRKAIDQKDGKSKASMGIFDGEGWSDTEALPGRELWGMLSLPVQAGTTMILNISLRTLDYPV